MTAPIQLQFQLSERAADRFVAEGGRAHGGLGLQWPCIPQQGDLLRFDWMLGGEALIVVAREFRANSDLSVDVTLHLDLVQADPAP